MIAQVLVGMLFLRLFGRTVTIAPEDVSAGP